MIGCLFTLGYTPYCTAPLPVKKHQHQAWGAGAGRGCYGRVDVGARGAGLLCDEGRAAVELNTKLSVKAGGDINLLYT